MQVRQAPIDRLGLSMNLLICLLQLFELRRSAAIIMAMNVDDRRLKTMTIVKK